MLGAIMLDRRVSAFERAEACELLCRREAQQRTGGWSY